MRCGRSRCRGSRSNSAGSSPTGRQPWTIAGVLPTHLSASSLQPSDLYLSLAGFILFYTALFVIEIKLMFKYARLGRRRCIPAAITTKSRPPASAPRREHAPETEQGIAMDYATLKLIWWLLVGVLLIGFAVGFDMGATALLPFLGKTDEERRIIVNTVGATWEGNQVWLITAGGAMFAAAARLRGVVLRLLLRDAARAVRAVLPAGGLRLPQQAARPALACGLGLGPVRRRLRAGARVRRRVRQPAARRAVQVRQRPARDLLRRLLGAAEPVRAAVRKPSASRCSSRTVRPSSR